MKDEDQDTLCLIALLIFIFITFIAGIQVGKMDERQRIKIQQQTGERP